MSLLRVTAQRVARPALARSFTVSAARADLVKELYVSQLQNYKVPAQAKDAHASVVRSYSAPATPTAPALPTDLAAELSKFDATEPTLGNKPAGAAAPQQSSEEHGQSAAEYLKFLEADLPKEEHH